MLTNLQWVVCVGANTSKLPQQLFLLLDEHHAVPVTLQVLRGEPLLKLSQIMLEALQSALGRVVLQLEPREFGQAGTEWHALEEVREESDEVYCLGFMSLI